MNSATQNPLSDDELLELHQVVSFEHDGHVELRDGCDPHGRRPVGESEIRRRPQRGSRSATARQPYHLFTLPAQS